MFGIRTQVSSVQDFAGHRNFVGLQQSRTSLKGCSPRTETNRSFGLIRALKPIPGFTISSMCNKVPLLGLMLWDGNEP